MTTIGRARRAKISHPLRRVNSVRYQTRSVHFLRRACRPEIAIFEAARPGGNLPRGEGKPGVNPESVRP
jgi:hypothetical protein